MTGWLSVICYLATVCVPESRDASYVDAIELLDGPRGLPRQIRHGHLANLMHNRRGGPVAMVNRILASVPGDSELGEAPSPAVGLQRGAGTARGPPWTSS